MPDKNKFQTVTADTRRLLNGQEGREVDFKEDPKAIHPEDLVAFANASGGTIITGVQEVEDENGVQLGKILGCNVDDRTKQAIIGKASSCRPGLDISIRVENVRTKSPILRVDIPEGTNKPYSTSSGTYKIRSEGRNLAMDPPLIRAMILESEANEFVSRFRHAADDLLEELQNMSAILSQEIQQVQESATSASQAAHAAAEAAQEAIGAAENAAAAAEDAAMGGY